MFIHAHACYSYIYFKLFYLYSSCTGYCIFKKVRYKNQFSLRNVNIFPGTSFSNLSTQPLVPSSRHFPTMNMVLPFSAANSKLVATLMFNLILAKTSLFGENFTT